jgi:hypothetical protein
MKPTYTPSETEQGRAFQQRLRKVLLEAESGGLSRNRTNDTMLFRHLLYQLSYQAKLTKTHLGQNPWPCQSDNRKPCEKP